MKIHGVPETAYIDPFGHNKPEIEKLFQSAIHTMIAKLSGAAQRAVSPNLDQVTAFQKQLACLPEKGVAEGDILEALADFYTYSTNVAHPAYMPHMSPLPTTFSLIGEIAAAAINNNMISLELAPLFTQLESRMVRDVAHRFGLGQKAGGVMLSGGSLSNLQALAIARNLKAPEVLKQGLSGKKLAILASSECHTSIARAAMTLGIGVDNVKSIPTTREGRMDIPCLEATIRHLGEEGALPICIVATAGTTVAGVIDPLPQIAKIAKAHDIWFHVDSAYGGALIFSERHKHLLAGIEEADSITFNPQKWLFVTKTCSLLMLKDYGILRELFSFSLPYMISMGDHINLGEICVQGSRHAEIVKVWASFQHFGLEGLAAIVDHGIALKESFVAKIDARPHLQMAHRPDTNVVCFRVHVKGLDESTLDQLNADLQQILVTESQIFLSAPTFHGRKWLKAVLLNPYISEDTLNILFDLIDDFVARRTIS